MIALIDYGMGNLKSVAKGLETAGGSVCVTRSAKEIDKAKKIVLPGVGAFPKCMENLQRYDLLDVIIQQIQKGKWFLGICLGFQLLFEQSSEFGSSPGMGLLNGEVVAFDLDSDLKVPHMGWNQIQKKGDPLLLKGIPNGSFFYFVHSYYVAPRDPSVIATTTDYGQVFCSSIQKDNLLACQFHPEKSQGLGLQVLKNFVEL